MTSITIKEAEAVQGDIDSLKATAEKVAAGAEPAVTLLEGLTAAFAISPSNPAVAIEVPDVSEKLAASFTAASDATVAEADRVQGWLDAQTVIQEDTAGEIAETAETAEE